MKVENPSSFLTIQLRYCFEDETSHSMNAEVFNECERQFIKIIKSTEKYFEDSLQVKIKPRETGSLIDVFTVAINNPTIVTTFNTLVTIFATKIFDAKFSSAKHKTDETSQKLQNIQKIKELIKAGTLTEGDFDYIASNDKDLRKQKSNFFKSAKKENEITKIETTTITNSHIQPTVIVVERKDFDKFILLETTELTEGIKDAKIYIVAPVLVQGKKSPAWRGICEENPIEFKITDKEFLQQVYGKQVKFSNGTFINCELKTTTTFNLETEETKFSRDVTSVVNYGEDNQPIKTISHKRKSKTKDTTQQFSIFNDNMFLTEY